MGWGVHPLVIPWQRTATAPSRKHPTISSSPTSAPRSRQSNKQKDSFPASLPSPNISREAVSTQHPAPNPELNHPAHHHHHPEPPPPVPTRTVTMEQQIPLNHEASAGSTNMQITHELPAEVVQCLENARFLHLATCTDNKPHVSLMNYTYLPSTPYSSSPVIVMTTNPASKKMNNLVANPSVSLLVHDCTSPILSPQPHPKLTPPPPHSQGSPTAQQPAPPPAASPPGPPPPLPPTRPSPRSSSTSTRRPSRPSAPPSTARRASSPPARTRSASTAPSTSRPTRLTPAPICCGGRASLAAAAGKTVAGVASWPARRCG